MSFSNRLRENEIEGFINPRSAIHNPQLGWVESRGDLTYSNCAFEAGPTPLLP
jgi:hypothetical protein